MNKNMKTDKQNNTRKNKQWLRNPNQRKNPKFFQVTMMQTKEGNFVLLGGESKVLSRRNQYANEWVNVDTRDLACEIRNNKIIAR
jgi:hypothetical protein